MLPLGMSTGLLPLARHYKFKNFFYPYDEPALSLERLLSNSGQS